MVSLLLEQNVLLNKICLYIRDLVFTVYVMLSLFIFALFE